MPTTEVKTANCSNSPERIAASCTPAGKETVGQPGIMYQRTESQCPVPDPSTNHCYPYPWPLAWKHWNSVGGHRAKGEVVPSKGGVPGPGRPLPGLSSFCTTVEWDSQNI